VDSSYKTDDSNANTVFKCIIHGKNSQKPAQARTNAKFHVDVKGLNVWSQIAVKGKKEIKVHSSPNTTVRIKNKIKTNITYMFLVSSFLYLATLCISCKRRNIRAWDTIQSYISLG
jgi:hypothetical protein